MPRDRHIHFHAPPPPNPITLIDTHTIISHLVKEMLFWCVWEVEFTSAFPVDILRWKHGLCQMKWCMSEWDSVILQPFYKPSADAVQDVLARLVWGRSCFYGNPKHRHKSRSRSLLTSFCRSKVLTSISEGVWTIWNGLCASVSRLVSDSQCLCSLQPFLRGLVCVWLMWISVWDWLTNAGAQRRLRVLLCLSPWSSGKAWSSRGGFSSPPSRLLFWVVRSKERWCISPLFSIHP